MSSNLEGQAHSSSPRPCPVASTSSSTSGGHVRSGGHLSDSKFRVIFNEMRLSAEMCDVQIQVEESSFHAHKLILAGCSPYFRGMFRRGHFDESSSPKIRIDPKCELGIRSSAVEQLIAYMYTGKIEIDRHNNIIDLIRAADHFQMTQIKNETLRMIEDHINFETYLDIRDVASVFNSRRLLDQVDRFIRKNFSQFVHTQAFLDVDESNVLKYLKHNRLQAETEEVIYDALLNWCRHNDKWNRFSTLAKYIRYDLLSVKFLLHSIRYDHDVRSRTDVTNFLLDSMQNITGFHTLSRPRFSTQVLVALPYRSRSFYLITFYGGDHVEFTVKDFPEMIHEHIDALINYSVCRIGKYLYMAGGTGYNANNEAFHSDRAFVYDVVKDRWAASTPLPTEANHFGLAALDSKIYLVSGGSGVNNTATHSLVGELHHHSPSMSNMSASDEVDCLEFVVPPRINNNQEVVQGLDEGGESRDYQPEWFPVARMNYLRSCVNLCVVGRQIFAIGGILDGGYTSTVERYDPDTDLWIEVDPMTQGRCNPGVAVAGGKIYVVGGLGDNLLGPPGALKSVEYYDPESDTWTSLPDMYFARHSPAVAYVNNKLFVFGGGSPSPLLRPGPERTIECFDFERHEWFVLQAKIPGRSNAVYVASYFDSLDI